MVLVMRHWNVCVVGACLYLDTLLHIFVADRVTAFCYCLHLLSG
ncbi:hypothetical protein FQN60_007499 [Etheostoma spectabile]|uniref:Uncharacterized protein n=1 Tax=Etheostoma spectabile TaxID=54343 RepID=A0A5J5CZ96_9PERO|nr:hypothetical protein FQN60_007499 [Etheostoma spectabile]